MGAQRSANSSLNLGVAMFDTADQLTIAAMIIITAGGILGLWLLPKEVNGHNIGDYDQPISDKVPKVYTDVIVPLSQSLPPAEDVK